MPRSFNEPLYKAKTLDELVRTYDTIHPGLQTQSPRKGKQQQQAYYKLLKLFGASPPSGNGTTTTAGGSIIVPTLSSVSDQLKQQGLQLVGLGQQVQGVGATTPAKSSGFSLGGFDASTLLLIGGGALAVYYFFRSR